MNYRNAALLSLANNELLNENEYTMKKLKSMQIESMWNDKK